MGRKVHPIGFRIGTVRDWQAKWYAEKHYPEFLHEDMKIRNAISDKYTDAGVSLVEIERQAHKVSVSIYTARPGIVIGRGGQRVDEVKNYLESLIEKRVQLNIQEIRQPELDAFLVARMVAEQIERRIAYRRAMKQALFRTMQAGAQGMKISCSGRLGGVEIARRQTMHRGRVPLHTLRADVDYGFTEARTTLGRIGVKVWIYRGDILPELEEAITEEIIAEPEAVTATEAEPTPAKAEKAPPAEKAIEVKAEAKEKAEVKKRAKAKVKEGAKAEVKAEAKPTKPRVKKKAEPKVEKAEPTKPEAKRAAKAKPAAKEKKAEVKVEEPAAEPKKVEKAPTKRKTKAKPAAKETKPAAVKEPKVKAKAAKEPEEKEIKAKKATKATKVKATKAKIKPEADIKTEETDVTTEKG
jgi:small subunit ribosomal protein S3